MLASAGALSLAAAAPSPVLAGDRPPPTPLTDRSTLTILRGDGGYSAQAKSAVIGAIDGQDVAIGDRLISNAEANMMLTFFEGTTFVLSPASDVVVQRVQGTPDSRDIGMKLNGGTIWARVAPFGGSAANFEVSSPAATAVVRGSQIGAHVEPDGTFQCWTRDGEMSVATTAGQQALLRAGQTVVVQPNGQIAANRAFTPAESMLNLQVSGAVWPIVMHPDGGASGVAAPGIVVSQTFGGLVAPLNPDDSAQVIEVPANQNGTYTILLEGREGDSRAYSIHLTALRRRIYGDPPDLNEEVLHERDLQGAVGVGEQVAYTLEAQVDRPGEQDAALQDLAISVAQPFDGAASPAKILISPLEVRRAGLSGD